MTQQNPSAPTCTQVSPARPGDLAIAIRVGQKMLDAYGDATGFDIYAYAQAHGALAESLRIVLRALGAEGGEGQ
ncbi:hypothetical protein ABZ504_03090 [Streptomyces mirabilis]|uniref:hypothetical protein n=1 Tax=Streptomyces mirabilis TaxID=68239 RepID=UPI0033E80807